MKNNLHNKDINIKREQYKVEIFNLFKKIEEYLNFNARLSFNDSHKNMESIFCPILNLVYDANFKNYNLEKSNAEAIDLIDKEKNIIIQVTSQNKTDKIKKTLNKKILEKYKDFELKFLILKVESNKNLLINKEYDNPFEINFVPKKDIIDFTDLAQKLLSYEGNFQKVEHIYQNIKYEILNDYQKEYQKNKNMTKSINWLIKILSKYTFEDEINDSEIDTTKYNIKEKIKYNKLEAIEDLIIKEKQNWNFVEKSYDLLVEQGTNLKKSILNKINSFYIKQTNKNFSNVEIFYKIIDQIIEYAKDSSDYEPMSEELLEMYVTIIVIHSFIECKIFKKPKGE